MRPLNDRIKEYERHAATLRRAGFEENARVFDHMVAVLEQRNDPWDDKTVDTRPETLAEGPPGPPSGPGKLCG